MAATITNVFAGTDTKIADVTWGADADTTATIAHGLGGTPQEVTLLPTAGAAAAFAALPQLFVSTIDATNVVVTKAATAGTAVAGAFRCIIRRPHSIGR